MEDNIEIRENVASRDTAEQKPTEDIKHVSTFEKISYIMGTSALGLFVGVVSNYRSDFLNNIIKLSESYQQIMNVALAVVGYLLNFFISYFIDNYKSPRGKFRTLGLVFCVPYAIFGFLSFYMPFDAATWYGLTYLIVIMLIYNATGLFSSTINNIGIVITPNEKERNNIMSWDSFFRSIFSTAPMLIVLLLGIFKDKGYFSANTMYFITSALCGVVLVFCTVNAMLRTRERIPYLKKKNSMLEGIKHVIKNKNFWWYTLSMQLRRFYTIGMGFGIFVAGALLGSTSKYLLIGLPTGVGTFIGMVIVQKLMKKMDPIKVYFMLCLYGVFGNLLTFTMGYFYVTKGGIALQVLFWITLIQTGFPYGATNIIPNIFSADILNELELQTNGKRLEQTIRFMHDLLGTVVGICIGILGPFILLNPKVIGYQQGSALQTNDVTIKLIFFNTLFIGIMYAIGLIPLIGYKLNTARRKEINALLEIQRKERAAISSDSSLVQ